MGERTDGIAPSLAAADGKINPHAPGDHLGIGKDIRHIVDRACWNALGLQGRKESVARHPDGFCRQQRHQIGAMAHAPDIAHEALVLRQLRHSENRHEPGELPVIADRDDHVPVGNRKDLIGHDIGVRIAHATGVCPDAR